VGKHSKGKVKKIGKHRRENTERETQTEAVEATAAERDRDKTIKDEKK
jgi:hypothetical protein